MLSFHSKYKTDELIKKWDEFTSPARFAGNDDRMDLIFVSKRRGRNLRLVRKASATREPFATIFRGKIKDSDNGSEIRGIFTKSIADYLFAGLILALLFYIRYYMTQRGDATSAIDVLLVVAILAFAVLLTNRRKSKRLYSDFICRITGETNTFFLEKK